MKQNQNAFASADELSSENKKYSIPINVTAVPRTPKNRKSFTHGTRLSGTCPVKRSNVNISSNTNVIIAAAR